MQTSRINQHSQLLTVQLIHPAEGEGERERSGEPLTSPSRNNRVLLLDVDVARAVSASLAHG